MPIELRPDRAVVRFSGPDAAKLLNDVLTGTFTPEAGPAHWWALLSPQGKIQAEGLAGWHEDAFWLDLHADLVPAFVKRMTLYRLRAKVVIEDLSESHAVGWSFEPVSGLLTDQDLRAPGLGYRVIAETSPATNWTKGDGFTAARVRHGITEIGSDYAADSVFPHDIAMDFLGGIDFEKGCYVGQEVVSRMKHRGTARRRPVLVSGPGLTTGQEVLAGGRGAGEIGPVSGENAVAILRLDRIAEGLAITSGGQPVTLALPEWASYRFGDSGAAE